MRYNITGLTKLTKQSSVATVTDGTTTVTFPLNPESLRVQVTGNVQQLPVLNTPNPVLYPQNGSKQITIPDVKFYTPGDSYDISTVLDRLSEWCTNNNIITLKYGGYSIRGYITVFEYTVTQMRVGKPTKATGSISLVELPQEKPRTTTPTKKVTPREVRRTVR